MGQGSAELLGSLVALEPPDSLLGAGLHREQPCCSGRGWALAPGLLVLFWGPVGGWMPALLPEVGWVVLGMVHAFKALSSGDINHSSSPTGVAHPFINDSCGFFCRGSVSCEVREHRGSEIGPRLPNPAPPIPTLESGPEGGIPFLWEPSPIWTQRQEPALLGRLFRAPLLAGPGSFIPAGPGSPLIPLVCP